MPPLIAFPPWDEIFIRQKVFSPRHFSNVPTCDLGLSTFLALFFINKAFLICIFSRILFPLLPLCLFWFVQFIWLMIGKISPVFKHCNQPQYDLFELRFPVPLSLHIPSGQSPGEQHAILHGYPLAGRGLIRMRITRLQDNQTEMHTFGEGSEEAGSGLDGTIMCVNPKKKPKCSVFGIGNPVASRPSFFGTKKITFINL